MELEYKKQLALLKKIITNEHPIQSYLFFGSNIADLIKIAILQSKKILCQKSKLDNCNCISCKQINGRQLEDIKHPDLIGLDFEWSESIKPKEGIKTMRNILHQMSLSPLSGSKKVAILRYADFFNKESANILLKKLEEPSPSNAMILLAKDIKNVLPTITSRTFNLDFDPPPVIYDDYDLSDQEKDWLNLVRSNVNDRFKLIDTITEGDDEHEFITFIEKYISAANRKYLKNNTPISDEYLLAMSSFFQKLNITKSNIIRTNANAKLLLEILMLKIKPVLEYHKD